ncbi:MAG: ABC transporter permease [Thermomicrobiales bacterium]
MSSTSLPASTAASPAAGHAGTAGGWLARHADSNVRPRKRDLRRYWAVGVPGAILLVFVLAAVLAPWIAPYNPNALDLPNQLARPTWAHPLGTDQLGRDQFSRLLYGGRVTLAMSAIATLGTVIIGLAVGVVSGYFGGKVDAAISTLLTVLLALPSLLLTLAILGILGPGTSTLLIALIGAGWVGQARIFRAAILQLREQLYVDAAISLGASTPRILLRHLVPNLATTVVVIATLDLGANILTVTSLSFLGLGVQPPTADWGTMLNDARQYFGQFPWLVIAPGLCITLVALTSNLLGDAIRDLVDVRGAHGGSSAKAKG